jgi:pimeloyl-ACP methyl ester carboxylesterase
MTNNHISSEYAINLDPVNPDKVLLGTAFKSDMLTVDGTTTLHYVHGGHGPAIIFLHGFSQDWYEFHKVMPILAKHFTVVAVDMPGIGKSTLKQGDYTFIDLAHDIHALVAALQLKTIYIVGHDTGGIIAYAFMRQFAGNTRGIMLLDAPLPGLKSSDAIMRNPYLWHFTFHKIPKLPEIVMNGHQEKYFKAAFFNRFAINKKAITEKDIAHYANAYNSKEKLSAGLLFYRTHRATKAFMDNHREKITIPTCICEGDYGAKEPSPAAKELAKDYGCTAVKSLIVKKSGHFMCEEQPEAIAQLIRENVS